MAEPTPRDAALDKVLAAARFLQEKTSVPLKAVIRRAGFPDPDPWFLTSGNWQTTSREIAALADAVRYFAQKYGTHLGEEDRSNLQELCNDLPPSADIGRDNGLIIAFFSSPDISNFDSCGDLLGEIDTEVAPVVSEFLTELFLREVGVERNFVPAELLPMLEVLAQHDVDLCDIAYVYPDLFLADPGDVDNNLRVLKEEGTDLSTLSLWPKALCLRPGELSFRLDREVSAMARAGTIQETGLAKLDGLSVGDHPQEVHLAALVKIAHHLDKIGVRGSLAL